MKRLSGSSSGDRFCSPPGPCACILCAVHPRTVHLRAVLPVCVLRAMNPRIVHLRTVRSRACAACMPCTSPPPPMRVRLACREPVRRAAPVCVRPACHVSCVPCVPCAVLPPCACVLRAVCPVRSAAPCASVRLSQLFRHRSLRWSQCISGLAVWERLLRRHRAHIISTVPWLALSKSCRMEPGTWEL